MSVYSLPPFLVGVVGMALCTLILWTSRNRPANVLYGISILTLTVWFLAYAVVYSAPTYASALVWVKVAYVAIVFIPTCLHHFIVALFNLDRERRLIKWHYLLSCVFAGMVLTNRSFIAGLYEYPWGYHTKVGPLHNLFMVFFLWVFARNSVYMYLAYRGRLVPLGPGERNRVKYLFWAYFIGIFGVIDFLPHYGIPIYPFGYLFLGTAAVITTYAIVRHRLMDISVAITRTAVFTLVYALVLGVPLLAALSWQAQLERMFGPRWWAWLWLLGVLLATAAHYANLYLRRLAENRLLAEQRHYQATLRQASEGMTRIRQLPRLLKLTVNILSRTVGLTHVAIYLDDSDTKHYVQAAARRKEGGDQEVQSLDADDPLIRYLLVHKNAVVLEEIRLQRQQMADPGLRDVEATLRQLKAAVVIPSFVHDRLFGFVVMGTKRSGQMYTDDDLKVLMTLANQAALAIENARFYERERSRQAEMAHTAQLASLGTMAGGMSHQLNNRFYVLTILAGSLRAVLRDDGDPTVLDPAVLQERWQRVLTTLGKLEDNAIRGGDIVKTLLNFSKPGPKEFVRLAMPDVLHTALELAQFRAKLDEVKFEQIMAEPLPPVLGNKNQLTEILVNLLANAYDAIKDKEFKIRQGSLVLSSEADYRGAITLSMAPFSKSGAAWFQLVVHDTGIGITPEHLPGLFVPFFTTKATAEKGTGLGLFIVKRIIEAHGGTLAVHSAYGEGTTFTIHLPALDEAA